MSRSTNPQSQALQNSPATQSPVFKIAQMETDEDASGNTVFLSSTHHTVGMLAKIASKLSEDAVYYPISFVEMDSSMIRMSGLLRTQFGYRKDDIATTANETFIESLELKNLFQECAYLGPIHLKKLNSNSDSTLQKICASIGYTIKIPTTSLQNDVREINLHVLRHPLL